jgi:hypothetical protein
MIDALGKLERDTEASVALVEIATAGGILKVLNEESIVFSARATGTLTLFKPVTSLLFRK